MDTSPLTGDPTTARGERRRRSHLELRRELVARAAANRTDLAAGPVEVDPRIYVDPARFELERRAFQHVPILACLSGDLPEPGSKLLFDALGPELLLVRGRDGRVRAFRNACPHRGARVVTECDTRARMTCRFHGWSFDLEGRLVGLPGAEGFEGIDRAARGLSEVAVAEWCGMVFVRVAPGGPIDVAAHLGSFADELAELELERARPMKHTRLETESNWKYAWDTYCESYHFGSLHARTVAPRVMSNVMLLQPFGRHARTGMPRRDWAALAGRPESEWPPVDYGGNYFIYPNINLNVSCGPNGEMFYGFYHLYPGARVGQTVTRMMTYRPGHTDPKFPDSDWTQLHDFIETVVRTEDYAVAEEGQRNLAQLPPGHRMLFGANEGLLQQWHRDWEATLAEVAGTR